MPTIICTDIKLLSDAAKQYKHITKSDGKLNTVLRYTKGPQDTKLELSWEGDTVNASFLREPHEFGCVISGKPFEVAVEASKFVSAVNAFPTGTLEITKTGGSLIFKNDLGRRVKLPITTPMPPLGGTPEVIGEVELEDLVKLAGQHSAVSAATGMVLFSGQDVMSVDSKHRLVMCVSDLLTELYPQEFDIKRNDEKGVERDITVDGEFCLMSKAFESVVQLLSTTAGPFETSFNIPAEEPTSVTWEGDGLSVTARLVATDQYSAMSGVLVKAKQLQATHEVEMPLDSLRDVIKAAQVPEDNKAECVIRFSNAADPEVVAVSTPYGAFNDQIKAKPNFQFDFAVRCTTFNSILRRVEGPVSIEFNDAMAAAILSSGNERFIMQCIQDPTLNLAYSITELEDEDDDTGVVDVQPGEPEEGTVHESAGSVAEQS